MTKKAFREYLNEMDRKREEKGIQSAWKNGKRGQTKRLYGDYLYFADRVMFDIEYAEWNKNVII